MLGFQDSSTKFCIIQGIFCSFDSGMKRVLQIGMVVMVLMGSIGIPFYQHTCLHENKVLSSVFMPSNDCSDEHQKVAEPSCCEKEKQQLETKESLDDACCLDEVSSWQFSFFFFQEVHPILAESFEELSIGSFFQALEIGWDLEDDFVFSGADPPALSVLERLTNLCIWRL